MASSETTRRGLRDALASLPVDTDAHGVHAPTVEEMFAPARHKSALDPATPLVKGARGSGKSFWAGVLGEPTLRETAMLAYRGLGLDRTRVAFGFTGLGGPDGVDRERLQSLLGACPTLDDAKCVWWATLLRATWTSGAPSWADLFTLARDLDAREARLRRTAEALDACQESLLVVYDALDAVATDWDRRRLLTDALFEVVWSLRAWRRIRMKLFIRPDQLDDHGLRFVELPKLRQQAVPLTWDGTDLYGMLFSRLALGDARNDFAPLLRDAGHELPSPTEALAHRWAPSRDQAAQRAVMDRLAGPFMAPGPFGYKRGRVYDWVLNHLTDGAGEVSPRSFLALFAAAASSGGLPPSTVIGVDGIKHGIRAASRLRVEQLQLEFRWIKAALSPLAGARLPLTDADVNALWERAETVTTIQRAATAEGYLPPFPGEGGEPELLAALIRIDVMVRRADGRVDMPDLFRVAAKMIKRGAIAP